MLGSTVTRLHPRTPSERRRRVGVTSPTGDAAGSGGGDPSNRPGGSSVLRAVQVERFNGKGHDVEIVRTEPRDVAPVIALPVRMHGNRVIEPLDVPAGTRVPARTVGIHAPEGSGSAREVPGPLARALMALDTPRMR